MRFLSSRIFFYVYFPSLVALLLLSIFATGCEAHGTKGNEPVTVDTPVRIDDPRPNIIIIFTDDQGYGDIGANQQETGVVTPHIDSLAAAGVRMTNGYVTAPQCTPSRAALMTGKYQQRFGVDDIAAGPLPLDVPTVADHLKTVGYRTGMVGKWHLEVTSASERWQAEYDAAQAVPGTPPDGETLLGYYPHRRGFDECFAGTQRVFKINFDLKGNIIPVQDYVNNEDRIELVNKAALQFIQRNQRVPFFLYMAPFAPHVPLEAAQKYLDRFPLDMPQRRRYALAMMAAVDDGVGEIVAALQQYGIYERTLIFYMSDNGAPLGLDMPDADISDEQCLWDGSLNTPLTGEKGMVTDGGVRVPYVAHWPERIPGGRVLDYPVSSLDAVYTALKEAGVSSDVLAGLDGTDLMPAIIQEGGGEYLNQRPLFWRFWGGAAVRLGNWKLVSSAADKEYLFDMTVGERASMNQLDLYQDKAAEMRQLLINWESTLMYPLAPWASEPSWYSYHMNL